MTTFGLVHGAYHGSWCWAPLRAELEQRGHRVLTVDLPCEDRDAGAIEYADAGVEAFADAADDLVLVGHSLGGLTIPLIATRRPVARLVYLCAMLPRPGRSHDDVLRDEPDMFVPWPRGGGCEDTDGATRWAPDAAAGLFFSDCPPELAIWAANQLRGQYWRITEQVRPRHTWPGVPVTSVIGTHDLVINPAWSRRVTPTVLGVVPIELACGHSPFLSVPKLLADTLSSARGHPGGVPGHPLG